MVRFNNNKSGVVLLCIGITFFGKGFHYYKLNLFFQYLMGNMFAVLGSFQSEENKLHFVHLSCYALTKVRSFFFIFVSFG